MEKKLTDTILFYESEFYVFSNFSSFAVEWQGKLWLTAEHAYQAAKFTDEKIRQEILEARSAHAAKEIAHAHESEKRSDWASVKLAVMEDILRAKLAQHPYVAKKLTQTGTKELIEDSPTDSFWGRGKDWKGENHLGKIWMKLRGDIL